jgi:glycosyltransferase involved in cell wall biosynthesis
MPKPLTIAVDIRDLRVAKTGTRTYLEEVCNEFKKMDGDDLRFYFFDTNTPVYAGSNKLLKLIEHARYQFWKQLVLPLKAFFKGCDIVFCTDNFVPIIHLGYKTIPVFHDAFFFETPEQYSKLWLWLYYKTAVPAAKRSPFVVTPTAYAKKQINHYAHIANEKLIVIHEGAKTLKFDGDINEDSTLLKSLLLTPHQYILHVGSMYKRKNIPALIYAFSQLKNIGYPGLKLVLAGHTPVNKFGNEDYQQILNAIADTKLENDIVLTGYMPDSALSQLYKNAVLYVFPSVNEGFGIPILEAFAHDLPVLIANNTCLPEVGGDAALQFDPFDTSDLFQKIQTALNDTELQKEMVSKGRERLKLFSWHKTVLELIDVFRKAV